MRPALYVDRRSPIHALPAGAKLVAMAAIAIAAGMAADPRALGAGLAACAGLAALARLPLRALLHQLLPAALVMALVFLVHWGLADWRLGLATVLRLGILVMLAMVVTLTTRVSAMMETLEQALAPLRCFGLRPAKLSLMLSLAIRLVPLLFTQLQEVREAQRARGLERSMIAVIVPLLIRALRLANDLSEAIEARCYDPD